MFTSGGVVSSFSVNISGQAKVLGDGSFSFVDTEGSAASAYFGATRTALSAVTFNSLTLNAAKNQIDGLGAGQLSVNGGAPFPSAIRLTITNIGAANLTISLTGNDPNNSSTIYTLAAGQKVANPPGAQIVLAGF